MADETPPAPAPAPTEAPATGIIGSAMESAKALFAAGRSNDDPAVLAERVTALEAERDAANTRIAELEAECDAANARADAAEGAAKASVTKGATPGKPRKVGPVKNPLSGDDLIAALRDADNDGKVVEIAFSDGKQELPGVAPARVVGEVWKDHTLGKMLRDPVTVTGPQGAPAAITGYGLLIDGKQVAWCQRVEPVTVAPGRSISLADDIWF